MRLQKLLAMVMLLIVSVVSAAQPIDTSNVVRVCVQNGNEQSWGSGAYLGQNLVLSCAHLFTDGPSLEGSVWFPDGQEHRFVCRQLDTYWDQSVLVLRTPPRGVKGLPVAHANPKVGEWVYAYGYGQGNRVMVTSGTVKGYKSCETYPGVADWLEMSGRVDQGSSGGPIVNANGHVVGNLWGVSGSPPYQTVGVITGRTRRFLLPWNAQLEAYSISQGLCPSGTCPTPPRVQVAPRMPLIPTPQPQPRPRLVSPDTSSPVPAPSTTAPSTCAPDIEPTYPMPTPTAEIDYTRLADELKADPEFMASVKGERGEPGPAGPAGPSGPAGAMGQNGLDGQDAELTAEHLATMTAAILQNLKSDPQFIEAARGPAGAPGETPDLAALVARIEALESAGTSPTGPSGPEWSHLILLASNKADYWSRLNDDMKRAQGYYHQLRHMEPPQDRDVGPLPLLVAYSDGKAVKSWVGLRDVTQAFSSISRGELDRFIFAEGDK